jgi:hypothetical protein
MKARRDAHDMSTATSAVAGWEVNERKVIFFWDQLGELDYF